MTIFKVVMFKVKYQRGKGNKDLSAVKLRSRY